MSDGAALSCDFSYRIDEAVDNLESGTDQISDVKGLIEEANMVSIIIAFVLLFFLAIRGIWRVLCKLAEKGEEIEREKRRKERFEAWKNGKGEL